jgi:hypothetical protein
MPDQVTTQVNKAVSNDSKATKQFADQEKEKIFEHKGQKERSTVTTAGPGSPVPTSGRLNTSWMSRVSRMRNICDENK